MRTGGARARRRPRPDRPTGSVTDAAEDLVAERSDDPNSHARDGTPSAAAGNAPLAEANGWDHEYEIYSDFELPTYVGPTTFMNLPWVTDPAQLRARNV